MMKRWLRRMVALFACIALTGVPAFAEQDARQLQFPADGKLRILVIADTQETQFVTPDLISCLDAALDDTRPDLVVFTGDQVEGQHPLIHLGDNEAHVTSVIEAVTAPVRARGIPFAVVFGNHDGADAGVSKEAEMAFYQSLDGCLAVDEGDSLPGCGTYNLVYWRSDGSAPALNLYFLDSGEYAGSEYASVTPEQIAWYENTASRLRAENGGNAVPALVFQHIIVPEIYEVLTPVEKGAFDDAFEGKGGYAGQYFSALLSSSIVGSVNEPPSPPAENTGEFAAWLRQGDVKAAIFGHDHVNNFVATLQGIDLVACPGTSYVSYGDSSIRGVKLFVVDENDIAEGLYDTSTLLFTDVEPQGAWPAVRRALHGQIALHIYYLLAAALCVALVVLLVRAAVRRRKAHAAVRR